MNAELDEYLVKRYPDIFRERHGSKDETSMYWGFQCGDGWFNIIDALCANIESHMKSLKNTNEFNQKKLDEIKKGIKVLDWVQESYDAGTLKVIPIPDVYATEVKEKFGDLRFSIHGGDEYIHGLISMASSISGLTCEECGKYGHKRFGGWIRTLCDDHAKKTQKESIEIKIGKQIFALSLGEFIKIEIVEVINENEVRGRIINDKNNLGCENDTEKKTDEYFSLKYIKNPIRSYWNAEKIDI